MELTTPVQDSSGVLNKVADLPNNGKRKNNTSMQDNLIHKHVNDVSWNKRKCFIEFRCLREIACLPPLFSKI